LPWRKGFTGVDTGRVGTTGTVGRGGRDHRVEEIRLPERTVSDLMSLLGQICLLRRKARVSLI